MKSFFSRSIRTHLLLLVILAMIPTLAIELHSGLELRSRARREAADRALSIERLVAFHQERVIETTRQLLTTLTKLPSILDRDTADTDAFLMSLLKQNPRCANLLIADTRGDVFASAIPITRINIADRQYFRDALATRDFSVGQFAVSRSARIPVIHFACPVMDVRGRVSAVVVAAFDLSYYGRLFSEAKLPEGSSLAVTDSLGTRLYRYPDSQKYLGVRDLPGMMRNMSGNGEEGTFVAPGVDGTVRLYAYRRMEMNGKGHNLFIRVGIPAAAIAAAERTALTRNLSLMGSAAILALLFAWFLGDVFFIRRLKRLVKAASSLGEGRLDTRSGIPHDAGEIGSLARTFDEMAASLEKRAIDRLQAEEALLESENRLKLVIQGSNDGFWDWDMKTGEVRHSDRWAEMLGYRPDEIVPCVSSWKSLVHPDEMPTAMKVFREHLAGLRSQYRMEYRMLAKSGEWKWILDRGKIVEWDENGEPLRMSGTATDISERKRMEEEKKALEAELLQAHKMEAIGHFAGGIAHDFSNLLTAISGFAEVLRAKAENDDLSREYAEQILKASERGTALTQSILGFSRKQPMKRLPVRLNDLVAEMDKLIMRLIGDEVELRTELSDLDPVIMADGSQLEQVLMNLASNARDAMPGGGMLTLRTDILEREPEVAAFRETGSAGRYAILRVSDTGTGMDRETLERIFEPFFSTKEVGKGTGLGLAMVNGIISQHDGHICVASEPGMGTSFSIYFPLHDYSGEGKVQGGEEMRKDEEGAILLAEDDLVIQSMYRQFLEKKGYRVVTADDGEDALRKFEVHGDGIALMLLDLTLPKKNGFEVYSVINRLRPEIKAIFISGYTDDFLEEEGKRDGLPEILTKPVHPATLMERVRQLLDDLPAAPL